MQRLRRVVVIAGLVGLGAVVSMALPSRREDSAPVAPRPVKTVVENEPKAARKLPRGVEVGFLAKDGLEIAGQLFQSDAPSAPVVIYLHRWGGGRDEFRPLLSEVNLRAPQAHQLLVDLRGHGQSIQRRGDSKQITFTNMTAADRAMMADDIVAVMVGLEARLKTRVPGFVLVGSDLGATVGAYVMQKQPRVAGLAMVSPGPRLNDLDLYAGLAGLRGRRGLVVATTKDNVSAEPLKVVTQMLGPLSEAVPIDGDGHGAGVIGDSYPALWTTLANWVSLCAAEASKAAATAPVEEAAAIDSQEPLVLPAPSASVGTTAVAAKDSRKRPSAQAEPERDALKKGH
ncbi:MAG: alpha/beta fold hydrolase [Polyangiaceae bacterium]